MKFNAKHSESLPGRIPVCLAGILIAGLTVGIGGSAVAAPVTPAQARQAASGWLALTPNPLNALPASTVGSVETFYHGQQPLFFTVDFQPAGFVVVAADDELEPIIAFTGSGYFEPDQVHPLSALIFGDLTARTDALHETRTANPTLPRQNRIKWQRLLAAAEESASLRGRRPEIPDVRVAPLIQTVWDQGSVGGALCYNYWTPRNYRCGCMATVMAQIMRYHQFPVIGVGRQSFEIKVDGSTQTRALLGGDGQGGAYIWDLMPLAPTPDTPEQQRQEIGALCHDAGIAAGTHYSAAATTTPFTGAMTALKETFMYSQALIGYNNNTNIGTALNNMINPGLDAGYPSVLGIFHQTTGHAVICDGYGYLHNTLYHHLNMGWGTSLAADNVWYALPVVDASPLTYNVIRICAYNIFNYGTGEIISGRVTDEYNAPLPGTALTLAVDNGPTLTTLTSESGVYAFAALPSNRDCTITADKAGYRFVEQTVRTGQSKSQTTVCGNRWNVNFIGQITRRPIVADYDGDGKADRAWYDESSGQWKIWKSGENNAVVTFNLGGEGWQAVPADYDGDGKTDPAVYRRETGEWHALLSTRNYHVTVMNFGGTGWIPVPADYDGDGKADPALYNPANGKWQALLSTHNYNPAQLPTAFGGSGWTPVPADYDGDGKTDPALHTTPEGTWMVLFSGNNYQFATATFSETSGSQPVPADYDGDGKADPALYNPAAGQWIIYYSSDNYRGETITFGGIGQAAAPADYSGNGKTDLGVYNPEDDTWNIR